MHVYLREAPVELSFRQVDAEGLIPDDSDLIPVAFYADGNDAPSFRAALPLETLSLLRDVTREPVRLGLLAEEPEDPQAEIQAMVGLSVPAELLPEGMIPDADEEDDDDEDEPDEPWKAGGAARSAEAWRGESSGGFGDEGRTILLAFAPLVRIARRHPEDFSRELADLLESALAGQTRPSLEARIDRMLGL